MNTNDQEVAERMQRLLGQVVKLLTSEGESYGLCIAVLVEAVGRLAFLDGRPELVAALLRDCADVLQTQGRATGGLQ